jgi:hypothetical protein
MNGGPANLLHMDGCFEQREQGHRFGRPQTQPASLMLGACKGVKHWATPLMGAGEGSGCMCVDWPDAHALAMDVQPGAHQRCSAQGESRRPSARELRALQAAQRGSSSSQRRRDDGGLAASTADAVFWCRDERDARSALAAKRLALWCRAWLAVASDCVPKRQPAGMGWDANEPLP